MKSYTYKAVDSNGNTTEGTLSARDHAAAISKLKDLKLSPISISQAIEKSSGTKGNSSGKNWMLYIRVDTSIGDQVAGLSLGDLN